MMHTPRSRSSRGFSLIEMLIAITLTAVAVLATGAVTRMSQQALKVGTIQADLEATALRIVDNIANEVKDSGKLYANFQCSPYPTSAVDTKTIRFSRCSGFSGSSPAFNGEDIQYGTVLRTVPSGYKLCLESTITGPGGAPVNYRTITDALSTTSRTYNGQTFTGIDFRFVTGSTNIVQITICLEGRNFLQVQNSGTTADDAPLAFAQTRVQLKQ
jgi:prepilin-type N-terminal cleavage/methylation domain-containing protein